jgi:gluconolactonase
MTHSSLFTNILPIKIADNFSFPEGASAAPDGSVYLVNCHNNVINKVLPSGDVVEYAHVRGKGNGTKLRDDGRLVVCDYSANCILEVSTSGEVTLITESDVDSKPLSRGPNDVVIAKNGDLYFTTPQGSSKDHPVGKVYHYADKTRETTIIAESLAFPNGLSLSKNEDYLYIAESAQSRVWRYPVLSPGKLGKGEVFIQLSGGHDPDGIDFDANGNLYIAYYGSRLIVIVDPDGQIIAELPAGGARPTNLSFGGPDGDWLYVTEAETNSLYLLKIGQKGLHLPGRRG